VDGFCDETNVVVVITIGFTVSGNGALVLDTSFVSPRYFATMLCEPIDSDDVVNVACPDEIVPVPSIVLESLNCTIPVAVFGDMVAVNVIGLPTMTEAVFELKTVEVDTGFAFCPTVAKAE